MRVRRKVRKASESETEIGLRVTSIALPGKIERADISRQSDADITYDIDKDAATVIATPYDLHTIAIIYEKSNILPQCVGAMVTNVASNGYRVLSRSGKEEDIDQAEKDLLESFIEAANPEESLSTLYQKLVHQYEKYGFSFVEIIRNKRNKPSILRHCNSSGIRLTKKTGNPVNVTATVVRGGVRTSVKEKKRFRKYIQEVNGKKTYFKEFGDPRKMSYSTGRYAVKDYKVKADDEATELLHRRQFSEDSYGIPRWISQLPSVLGSREAEEVNLRYFEDNTVPPMILSVAGGRLTRTSYTELQQILQQQGIGKDRQNKIILIEAVPEVADIDGKGTVSLKIDKLTDARQSDGLFKEYDESNMSKIRSSFRLPPVVLGLSQDVTFATANVSAYLAEVQVFKPERAGHDEWFNMQFVNHPKGLSLKTVKLESKGPSNTNPDQIVKTLTATNAMGGVTPRSSIDAINETFQLNLPQYPEATETGYQDWMDMPLVIGQKIILARTQQTGEGKNDDDDQDKKDQDIKDREKDGETNPEPVEHGNE